MSTQTNIQTASEPAVACTVLLAELRAVQAGLEDAKHQERARLTKEGGSTRPYDRIVDASFHISMACAAIEDAANDKLRRGEND